MKFEELYTLLAAQNDKYRQLKKDLLNNANMMRDTVSRLIDAPDEHWVRPETGQSGQYVEAVLIEDTFPTLSYSNIHTATQEDGSLIFGVSIGLTPGINKFPINYIYQKVAIRYVKKVAQFAIISEDSDEPKNWNSDHVKICENIITELAHWLSHDPYDGEQAEKKIGFVIE